MAYALNNVTVGDAYSDSVTLRCPGAKRITVDVSTSAVYAQFAASRLGVGTAVGGEQWESEQFLKPGTWVYDEVDSGGAPYVAIRFRNANTSATDAQVTAMA